MSKQRTLQGKIDDLSTVIEIRIKAWEFFIFDYSLHYSFCGCFGYCSQLDNTYYILLLPLVYFTKQNDIQLFRQDSIIFYDWVVFHHVYVPCCLSSHHSLDICGHLGWCNLCYCELNCCKHGTAFSYADFILFTCIPRNELGGPYGFIITIAD